jgi:hypothetical protein
MLLLEKDQKKDGKSVNGVIWEEVQKKQPFPQTRFFDVRH